MLYLHHKHKIMTISLLFSLVAGGCKKLIEIDPPVNTVNTGVVFKDPAKVEAALSGIYLTLMPNDGTAMTFANGFTTIYAGMLADELQNQLGTSNPVDYQFVSNKLKLDNAMVTAFWTPSYKAIYTANSVMEGLAKSTATVITDSIRNQTNGECLFARAFCYFYLTNLYGDVPLTLNTEVMDAAKMSRTPVAQVQAQMEADLQRSIQLLPEAYSTGTQRIRPNKFTAMALLARLYLYEGKWQDAADMASQVISSSQYALVPLTELFNKADNREVIWALKYTSMDGTDDTPTPEIHNLTATLPWSQLDPASQEAMRDAAFFTDYQAMLVPAYFMTTSLGQAFEPGDQRMITWTDSLHAPDAAPWNGGWYRFVYKYHGVSVTGELPPAFNIVFRLGEQYLIRAEALARLDNVGGAAADINQVRTRAGLPGTTASTQSALLDAVMQERRIEFFGEWGHRWFDLKRTAKAASILGAIPEKQPWSDNWLVLPIPVADIQNDPALIQNPGYSY